MRAALLALLLAACTDPVDRIDTDMDGRRSVAEVCAAMCACEDDIEACVSECAPDEDIAECVLDERDAGRCWPTDGVSGTINNCIVIVRG